MTFLDAHVWGKIRSSFWKVTNHFLSIHPKIPCLWKKLKITKNSCCNGLHHFPWIQAFLEVPQTFMPSWNVLDIPILNYLWHFKTLEIDKWTHHYKPWLWKIHLQVVYVLLHWMSNTLRSPIWCKKLKIIILKLFHLTILLHKNIYLNPFS